MAKFKPQTAQVQARNRLRRQSQLSRRLRHLDRLGGRSRRTPCGALRALRRSPKNMPSFRAQQKARNQAHGGTFRMNVSPEKSHLFQTLERQVDG